MEDLLDRLDEIGRLTYDWNGYQAEPFSQRLIDKCKEILLCLFRVAQQTHRLMPTGA